MKRREFLGGVGAVGSWLVLGASVPKMLGDPAGGFHAPVPYDLEPYVKWHDVFYPPNVYKRMQICSLMALWAAPGAEYGQLAEWAGSLVFDGPLPPSEMRDKLLRSLRACLVAAHEPGWLETRVTLSDGESSELRWKRCGYLRWLKVSDVERMSRDILVKIA